MANFTAEILINMKNILLVFLMAATITSCWQRTERNPETALDTGREFIRASLNGDFDRASDLLLQDTQNVQLFKSYKALYNKWPDDQKKAFKDASYEINKYLEVDDSTTLINYSNTYMNKPMEIKLVRSNKKWAVDFKYTVSGNLPIE